MPRLNFSGSICALATPFGADDALDLAAWRQLLRHQIAGGTQGLVVAGSTGEAHALDEAEIAELLRIAVDAAEQRIPVIAGTGGANTHKTIAATRRAQAAGANAALVVTPYYVRPTQAGLLQHYRAVADEGGLPIILYNVPSRTGCDLLPETVAQLAEHPNIVGIKEARPEMERVSALLALQSNRFSVLSGDDGSFVASMLAGARGVISVVNNLVPRTVRRLSDAATAGNTAVCERLQARLAPLLDALGVESNPIPLKWCLAALGIGTSRLRLPLTELSESARDPLRALVLSLQDEEC
ncbi:MAG: 4-hydroxy-tetrahydrodipicolinate synthase [Tahibacter sp.]